MGWLLGLPASVARVPRNSGHAVAERQTGSPHARGCRWSGLRRRRTSQCLVIQPDRPGLVCRRRLDVSARFSFALLGTDGTARLGEVRTPRGVIRTPAFMPVGTAATVKAV